MKEPRLINAKPTQSMTCSKSVVPRMGNFNGKHLGSDAQSTDEAKEVHRTLLRTPLSPERHGPQRTCVVQATDEATGAQVTHTQHQHLCSVSLRVQSRLEPQGVLLGENHTSSSTPHTTSTSMLRSK